MNFPLLTEKLAAQFEKCDTYYIGGRLQALEKLEGNPYGADVRQFDGATGMLVRSMPSNPVFNRVADFGTDQGDRLDEITEWYAANKVNCRFDIVPGQATPQLLRQLAEGGFYQSGFYTVLYGSAKIEPVNFKGVTVREIEQDELSRFGDMYIEGHNFPAKNREVLALSIKLLFGQPDVRFYFGLVDNELAGVALLMINDGIGYLATAATLPQFRNRGCQKALLQHRMLDAAQAGCELVASHTGFASASQHNMEKMGMRLAYTKAIWTELK